MLDWLMPFTFWHWWLLGIILLVLELTTFTTYFLWIGFAALITGTLAWLVPTLAINLQWMIFGVISVVNVIIFVKFFRKKQSPIVSLNQRANQLIGQQLTLSTPIENGRGKAQIGETQWLIKGPDLPANTKVVVIGTDDTWLIIEPSRV